MATIPPPPQVPSNIDAPKPSDSKAVFNQKAFAAWSALGGLGNQINATTGWMAERTTEVNTAANNAATSKNAAADSANAAASSANIAAQVLGASASQWVSRASYTKNQIVWLDAVSGSLYRALQTHSNRTTSPKTDGSYWAVVADPTALDIRLATLLQGGANANFAEWPRIAGQPIADRVATAAGQCLSFAGNFAIQAGSVYVPATWIGSGAGRFTNSVGVTWPKRFASDDSFVVALDVINSSYAVNMVWTLGNYGDRNGWNISISDLTGGADASGWKVNWLAVGVVQ